MGGIYLGSEISQLLVAPLLNGTVKYLHTDGQMRAVLAAFESVGNLSSLEGEAKLAIGSKCFQRTA